MKLIILGAAFAVSWVYAMPWPFQLGRWKSLLADLAMITMALICIAYLISVAEPLSDPHPEY